MLEIIITHSQPLKKENKKVESVNIILDGETNSRAPNISVEGRYKGLY
jgi:hypothetical protein